jgi:hypothetical protein
MCQLYWVIKAHLIKQTLDNIRSLKKKTLDIKNKKNKDKNKRTHTKTVTKMGETK